MLSSELVVQFAAVFLICGLATWVLLLIVSRSVPVDFQKANMRGQGDESLPVRQLGGLVIIPVLIVVMLYFGRTEDGGMSPALFVLALAIVWITGILDDLFHLPVVPRLAAQVVAAAIAVYALGPELRIFPYAFPYNAEKILEVLFLVWFMNIANFMDGLDLMTVSGLGVPAFLAGILFIAYSVGGAPLMLAAGISGTLAGFAPFNVPEARLYLGDGGSLPLGLAAGMLSIQLAGTGNILSALLIFAYYHGDAGLTLLRRLKNRENIFAAHTSHFYQRASRAGVSAISIAIAVCALNLVLIGAAAVAMTW